MEVLPRERSSVFPCMLLFHSMQSRLQHEHGPFNVGTRFFWRVLPDVLRDGRLLVRPHVFAHHGHKLIDLRPRLCFRLPFRFVRGRLL